MVQLLAPLEIRYQFVFYHLLFSFENEEEFEMLKNNSHENNIHLVWFWGLHEYDFACLINYRVHMTQSFFLYIHSSGSPSL